MTWRPIESAPERTPILLFVPNLSGDLDRYTGSSNPSKTVVGELDGNWHCYTRFAPLNEDDYSETAILWNPTHWMPLPEAPQ